ncbi:MAG: FtsX-like permease family protein [Lentisphaeria bacterium]|nr:FtsX-like permease family protein [Lentisphaeria bacterium]NQZ69937.1 FtsX-like permease family protein [Lentisphaeria bacterium]
MSKDDKIKDQVRLPMSVAIEVVWQGIKIRFGRSVVTVTGVVLGIAFLMSILVSDLIKQGVATEDGIRNQVKRMENILSAELGPAETKSYHVLTGGTISDAEIRFLTSLHEKGAVLVAVNEAPKEIADLLKTGSGKDGVLVLGSEKASLPESIATVIFCRNELAQESSGKSLKLDREMSDEEKTKIAAVLKTSKFRQRWIIIISLFVTIICISNSMLMSVTERFKEIGTMKCLGALSQFIRQLFLIESSMMGLVGSAIGCIVGFAFSAVTYSFSYGFAKVFNSLDAVQGLIYFAACMFVGIILSILAAIYPATIASRMVPADALRSNI